jgi:hypothetical protein
MRQNASILSAIALLISIAWAGCAATISKTGTLTSPKDSILIDFSLVGGGTVTLQTYGFGRGENAARTEIPSVEFDPFVGFFSGTGPGAVFISGPSGILSNCSPGCPPAGTLAIGSVPNQCGDVRLQFTDLAAGPTNAAAGSLCNSPALAIVANVNGGHGISLRGLSGIPDCPGRSGLSDGPVMETAPAGDQLTYE